jgi:hypothetical protein
VPHPKGREISGCRFATFTPDGSAVAPCGRRGRVHAIPGADAALTLCDEHAAVVDAGPVEIRTWNGRRWVGPRRGGGGGAGG